MSNAGVTLWALENRGGKKEVKQRFTSNLKQEPLWLLPERKTRLP